MLRIAAGATACVQGILYLADRGDPAFASSLVGLIAVSCGAAIILGVLTPVAGSVVGLGTIALQFSRIPVPQGSLLNAALPAVIVATVAISIALLGPGALSIDARLFGRREIIIRQTPKTGSGPSHTSIEG